MKMNIGIIIFGLALGGFASYLWNPPSSTAQTAGELYANIGQLYTQLVKATKENDAMKVEIAGLRTKVEELEKLLATRDANPQ